MLGTGMEVVVYRPAAAVEWLNRGNRSDRRKAISSALSVPHVAADQGVVKGVQQMAKSAYRLGKQALGDYSTLKAEEKSYTLFEGGLEVQGLGRHQKIDYSAIERCVDVGKDGYDFYHTGGILTIKPVAHIVSGTLKVPLGWTRNQVEVEYELLVEEICARCGITVTTE